MIRTIEELSMNAWPALQTVFFDGWVIRFANGYSSRANSIYPLYPPKLDIETKIHACEQLYRERGLSVIFKMTSACNPSDLDAILEAEGYEVQALTSVQTLDLRDSKTAPVHGVETSGQFTEAWFTAQTGMNNVTGERQQTARKILANITPGHCFASITHQGQIIACGLGVFQAGHVGLFDIVTGTNFRRKGYGRQVVAHLLDWGKQAGAHTAYLQVMKNNPPALQLYDQLGFREAYPYWYRVKP